MHGYVILNTDLKEYILKVNFRGGYKVFKFI